MYIPGSDSGPGDSVSITVTSPGGTSPNTPADQFTYTPLPTLVVYPAPGSTVAGSPQWLDATATSGATGVKFELTGGTLADSVIASGTLTLYGWLGAFDTRSVPNGTYTLQSVASYSGGVTVTSPGITLIVNNPSPTTTVVYPAGGTTVKGTLQWLDATASSGVTSVTYELSGGSLTNKVIASGTSTLYGWLGAFDTTAIPNGTYTLQSVASYAGGVSGTSPGITITVAN